MEKINIHEAIKIVKKIYIEISESEAEIVLNGYSELCSDIEEMKKIDVNEVDIMDYPVVNSEHTLRDDNVIEECSPREVFQNSKTFNGKHVVIK